MTCPTCGHELTHYVSGAYDRCTQCGTLGRVEGLKVAWYVPTLVEQVRENIENNTNSLAEIDVMSLTMTAEEYEVLRECVYPPDER